MARKDYQHVFAKAKRFQSDGLTVLARKNAHAHPRIGIMVAKKHVSKAVQRNRIKRIIRDCFRKAKGEIPAVDLIFIARKDIGKLSNSELRDGLTKVWEQLRKYYKD